MWGKKNVVVKCRLHPLDRKLVPSWCCSQQRLRIIWSSRVTIPQNRHWCLVFQMYFFTNEVPPTSILTKRRLTSCVMCHQKEATLGHMLFVFDGISYVCQKTISPSPLMAIFGGHALSKSSKKMVAFATRLARKLILVNWKSQNVPTHKRWLEEVKVKAGESEILLSRLYEEILQCVAAICGVFQWGTSQACTR